MFIQPPFMIAICIFILSFQQSVMAQNGDEDLEELGLSYGDAAFISIATGRSQPITKAPAVATVITSKEIEQTGARTIDEVLESVPGLHVSYSSTRLSPIYSMRGIHTDRNPQVLMLLNGSKINQLYFGDRGPVSSLPVKAISRIEIIRGPGSAIYGADAFAGVINIITKTANDYNGHEVGGRLGEFGTRDIWYSHGGIQENGIETALSLQYTTTDGDDNRVISSDAQSIFDNFLSTSASYAPGPLDTQLDRLDINFEVGQGDWKMHYWSRHIFQVGSGPGVAFALDPEGDGEVNDYLLDFTVKNIVEVDGWDTQLKLSYYDVNTESKSTLFPKGSVLPIDSSGNVNPLTGIPTLFPDGLIGNPAIFEERLDVEIVAFSNNFDHHAIRVATGLSHSSLKGAEQKNFGPGVTVGTLTDVSDTEFIFVESESRDVFHLSIQDEIDLDADWELTAGIRYDDYSDFGSTYNHRLALVWETYNNLTTKFLLGRAFRAPSFAESFAINNPVVLGNKDLDPEIINTFEIAFDYSPGLQHHAGLSLYGYRIEDLIQFVTDGTGASTAQNTGKQTGQGLEFEWVWKPEEMLTLTGNISLAKARDDESNSSVANFPEKQLYLKAAWSVMNGLEVVPELHFIGDRNRAEADPREAIKDYTLVNLLFNKTSIDGDIKWSFGVKNLTDENYSEPSPFEATVPAGSFIPDDFPGAGRMFFVTSQVKF